MIGVRLKKDKKTKETIRTGSNSELIVFLSHGKIDVEEKFRRISPTGWLQTSSPTIAKKLGVREDETIVFDSLKTVETLGFYLNSAGDITSKKKTVDMSSSNYMSYDFTTNHPSIALGTKTLTYNLTEGMKYTFGVEIETASGLLHPKTCFAKDLNVSCIRDGSIAGGEYVSGVLRGDAGMVQMHNLLGELRSSCTINKTCGIHVHVGTANFNKAFTVYAYILGLRLEDEVFQTLPPSRTNNEYCDKLRKLPTMKADEMIAIINKHGFKAGVDICYDELYKGMSYGDLPDEKHNKLHPHKNGRYCGKYQGVPINNNFRYKWLNLIPTNFNMKKAKSLKQAKERCTIEFRNHGASLSYVKVRNWVLFCMAFVSFVENHKEDITNPKVDVTLDYIFSKVFKLQKARKLSRFFNERKRIFSTDKKAEKEEYAKSDEKIIKKRKDICVL